MAYAIELSERIEENTETYRLAEILFREILVSPRIEIDDLPSMETYTKVFDFLLDTANGEGFGKKLSKSKLKRKARDNWSLWRLIFDSEGALDYTAVFGKPFMSPQDVIEANFALDMVIDARKKAAKKRR